MSQELLFQVYDQDLLSKNDIIGEYRMTLRDLLNKKRNGEVHLALEAPWE